MRHSFCLHLALGLLSWSSQLAGASVEPQNIPHPRSSHQTRPEGSVEKRNPYSLALMSTRKAASTLAADR